MRTRRFLRPYILAIGLAVMMSSAHGNSPVVVVSGGAPSGVDLHIEVYYEATQKNWLCEKTVNFIAGARSPLNEAFRYAAPVKDGKYHISVPLDAVAPDTHCRYKPMVIYLLISLKDCENPIESICAARQAISGNGFLARRPVEAKISCKEILHSPLGSVVAPRRISCSSDLPHMETPTTRAQPQLTIFERTKLSIDVAALRRETKGDGKPNPSINSQEQ